MTRSRMVGLAVCCSLWLLAVAPAAEAGPVALWHMDEGSGQVVGDTWGNANVGVLGTTPATEPEDPAWIPGRLNRALRFVGERNQFVTVVPVAGLHPEHLTVQAWVRRDGSPGRWRYVVSMGGVACDRSSYGLYSGANGGIAFYVSDATRYVLSPTLAPATVWDGQWHLITGSYDGARVQLHLDGTRVGTGTLTSLHVSYSFPDQNLLIGSYRAGCDLPFTGDIDEVSVWGSALTPTEIENETQSAATQPAPVDAVPPVSGAPPGAGPPIRAGDPPLIRCLAVNVSTRTIRTGKRARITVRVGQGKRPVARAVVHFRGPGVTISRLTDRAGRVRVILRPRRRATFHVTVRGQPLRCVGTTVTAR